MRLFKCLCLGIIAILLCGCGESRAEFSPLNLGKVDVVYENQTLKIAESRANSACGDFLGSASARFVNEPKSSISSPASHNPKNSSTILEFASCKSVESALDSADSQNLVKNNHARSAHLLKASSGVGEGVVREGEGSDFAIQAPAPSLKKNARSEKGDFNADLSAQGRKENRDSSPTAQNDNLSNSAESSLDSAPKDNAPFILFFFTSTCGVCKAQIPILEQLSVQGIKIYAILGDVPNINKASAFASAHKISLPLFYESGARRFFTRAVGGVKGVPVMAVFNNGKMKEKLIGLTPKSTLLRVI